MNQDLKQQMFHLLAQTESHHDVAEILEVLIDQIKGGDLVVARTEETTKQIVGQLEEIATTITNEM